MIPLKLKHPKSISIRITNLFTILMICMSSTTFVDAFSHSVQTYRQSSTQLGQLVTSSTLVWESYTNDRKQLEYAIKGGSYISEDVHYPIYVCRASVEGLYISGHTEKRLQKYVCAVSLLGTVKTHHSFDILVNKGHLGKVAWKPWRKAGIPIGAIVVTMGSGLTDATYVARHRNGRHHGHHESNEIAGADYNLGRLDPSIGLGKLFVSDGEREHEFNDGEVLVETEPFRYELKSILLDTTRMDIKINTTELGSSVLENRLDSESKVETVISFKYNKAQYWGTHDGVARGLPTKIYESDRTHDTIPDEIKWGLRYSELRIETKTVSTSLPPGTALNVTLKGNYTSMEAPYRATLIAYYYGSDEKVSREISSAVQKSTLRDIKLEFSPVYWIENGTFIPTTTTTTTTSTTTEPTTTSTDEPRPITEPKIYIDSIGPSSVESSSSSGSSSSSSSSSSSDDAENIIQHGDKQHGALNLKSDSGSATNLSLSIFLLLLTTFNLLN